MKAVITGENDERVGVNLLDNNDVEHVIEMEFDGELKYHESDGYPEDDRDCTREQIELINQACRFARYHVYRERGYDTIPSTENPDRLLAAMIALLGLPEEEFEALFGDLERQLRSHYDNSTVSLPFDDVDPDEVIIYEKELYVTPNPIETKAKLQDEFAALLENSDTPSDSSVESAFMELIQRQSVIDDLRYELEAVSDLQYRYDDGYGNEQVHRPDSPLDRDPDARIELLAQDPAQFDSLRLFLVAHLGYQIRDCYLSMGLEPPETFQERGTGTYDRALDQKFSTLYDDYWNDEAQISSWQPKAG